MKKFLILVDIQKDFVDGSLGTAEAQAMIPAVVEKIRRHEGKIFVTLDTHGEDYLETSEGRHLPVVHCVRNTEGWRLNGEIEKALVGRDVITVEKPTFGSVALPELLTEAAAGDDFETELIGLCTDICVVSNALLLKASFPEKTIKVDAACCAGVTPETHNAALSVMRCCQIEVENG